MWICNRICHRVFCQNLHIAYFSAYNGIFRITYAKIMLHVQKFAYMSHISAYPITFFSIFFVQCCFQTTKYFGSKQLPVFANQTLNKLKSKTSKLCRKGLLMIMIMILRYSNLHMPEICRKICRIYATYVQLICRICAPHISPNSIYFSTYFASKSSAYFKKILRCKPTFLLRCTYTNISSRSRLEQNPQRLGLGAICLGLGPVGLVSGLRPLRLVETFCADARRAYCSCS